MNRKKIIFFSLALIVIGLMIYGFSQIPMPYNWIMAWFLGFPVGIIGGGIYFKYID